MLTHLIEVLIGLAMVAALTGVAGMASAWALMRGLKGWPVIIAASLSAAAVLAVWLLSDNHWDAASAWGAVEKYLSTARDTEMSRWSKAGIQPANVEVFRHLYTQYIVLSFPAWLLLTCLVLGMFSSSLTASLLSRATPGVERFRPFKEWVIPEPLVFGFLVGCFLKLFRKEGIADHHLQNLTADNLLVFFMGLYTVGGLCVISHFFHKWRFPFMVRLLGYFLLFNLASMAAACFGILDIWFDFRKIKTSVPREVAS